MSFGGVDLSHLAGKGGAAGGAGAGSGVLGSGFEAGAASGTQGNVQGAAQSAVQLASLVFEVTTETWEQTMRLSAQVPVVLLLVSGDDAASEAALRTVHKIIVAKQGALVLGVVDTSLTAELSAAFGVGETPAGVALIAGRPAPLFQGAITEPEFADLAAQLLQLAAQHGVTGVAEVSGDGSDGADAQPQHNPAHEAGLQALNAGDYATAIAEFERIAKQDPCDEGARIALAHAQLLQRLEGKNAGEIRDAAAATPDDAAAQMLVADLDLSGGHVEDALLRLLEVYEKASADEKPQVQQRLLDFFEIVGQQDPRVMQARRRFAMLMY